MANKTSEEFIESAQKNIEADRGKLEEVYDKLMNLSEIDPLAALGISENLVRIVDSLTKQNSQLVELAKIMQRSEDKNADPGGGVLSSRDKDEVYDEINESGVSSSIN